VFKVASTFCNLSVESELFSVEAFLSSICETFFGSVSEDCLLSTFSGVAIFALGVTKFSTLTIILLFGLALTVSRVALVSVFS